MLTGQFSFYLTHELKLYSLSSWACLMKCFPVEELLAEIPSISSMRWLYIGWSSNYYTHDVTGPEKPVRLCTNWLKALYLYSALILAGRKESEIKHCRAENGGDSVSFLDWHLQNILDRRVKILFILVSFLKQQESLFKHEPISMQEVTLWYFFLLISKHITP